jgi:hypothetical protein
MHLLLSAIIACFALFQSPNAMAQTGPGARHGGPPVITPVSSSPVRPNPFEKRKAAFRIARWFIRYHTGLYAHEDLLRDVLSACDNALKWANPNDDFTQQRQLTEGACRELIEVASRQGTARGGGIVSDYKARAISQIDEWEALIQKTAED